MKIPVSLPVVLVVAAGMAAVRVGAQASPAFEVVSVKRNLAGGPTTAYPEPGGLVVRNYNALELVELAYELPEYRVTGGPGWAATERFDVSARAANGTTFKQMRAMLQSALVERFQFAARLERRDQQRYALVLDRDDGRLGSGLRPATAECVPLLFPQDAPQPPPPPPGPAGAECPSIFGPGFMSLRQADIPAIADHLARESSVRRVVVDRTGLAGKYNADASWSFEGRPGPAGAVFRTGPDRPNLFTALREQLGLRLQDERGPVDVLVIDRMERPTED